MQEFAVLHRRAASGTGQLVDALRGSSSSALSCFWSWPPAWRNPLAEADFSLLRLVPRLARLGSLHPGFCATCIAPVLIDAITRWLLLQTPDAATSVRAVCAGSQVRSRAFRLRCGVLRRAFSAQRRTLGTMLQLRGTEIHLTAMAIKAFGQGPPDRNQRRARSSRPTT